MNDLVVDPTGMAAYRAHADDACAHFAAGAGLAESAEPRLLAPAFGLMWGDLATAYATAHAAYVGAVTRLGVAVRGMSAAVGDAAEAYAEHDLSAADSIASAAWEHPR